MLRTSKRSHWPGLQPVWQLHRLTNKWSSSPGITFKWYFVLFCSWSCIDALVLLKQWFILLPTALIVIKMYTYFICFVLIGGHIWALPACGTFQQSYFMDMFPCAWSGLIIHQRHLVTFFAMLQAGKAFILYNFGFLQFAATASLGMVVCSHTVRETYIYSSEMVLHLL